MSLEYEKRLAAEIDRELASLPELPAPATLVPNVLRAIARPAARPWYAQPWPVWPAPVRVAVLVVLSSLFAIICYAAWKLPQYEGVSMLGDELGSWIAGAVGLWKAVNLIAAGLVCGIKHLGTGFLLAAFAAFAGGYAFCVGLTAFYLRLGLARRPIYEPNQN